MLVWDTDEHLAGVLSERHILTAIAELGTKVNSKHVCDLMTKNVNTIGHHATLHEALNVMTNEKIRHLVVLEDEKLAG